MDAVKEYFTDATETIGKSWNRFWFTPSDAFPLSVLRILVGLACLYFLISQSADLVRWFGPHGLLPWENIRGAERATDASQMPGMRISYFNWITAPSALWIAHVAGMAVVVALTVGFYTRATAIMSLVVVLSYIHRAPIITGQFEPILTMMLFCLCLAPAGQFWSIDRLLILRRQDNKPSPSPGDELVATKSSAATVAIRLLQVHVSLFYLTMGLCKLGGISWWNGDAAWWLIAHTESRLVNLTFLHSFPYAVDLWTHMILLFELSFGMLIWNRWARPILLAVAVPMWLSLALVTGLVSYCLIMLVANLVFVDAAIYRAIWNSYFPRYRIDTDPSAK